MHMLRRSVRLRDQWRTHMAGGIASAVITAVLAIGGLSVMALASPSDGSAAIVPASAAGIPDAVRLAVPAVVALRQASGSASGVALDQRTVATAGHVAVNGGQVICSRLLVSGSSTHAVATAVSVRYGGGSDVALVMQASDTGRPTATVSTVKARRGDTVYFANWQNRIDGAARTSPAVFSGIVLAHRDGSYTLAVRNDAGYKVPSDSLLRPGGSGGAVLDSEGRLLAVSVSVDDLSAVHSAGNLRREYGTRLPAGWYQVTRAQALTPGLVDDLRKSVTNC